MARRIKMNGARAMALIPILALAGCADAVVRHDEMWSYAGDAVAANRAIQTIDPWPRASESTRFATNGAVIARAMARYRSGAQPEVVRAYGVPTR